jgi:hypothetical protein
MFRIKVHQRWYLSHRCTLLYNLHLAISFPYFAVVLFFPSSSLYFEGSVRLLVVIDSLRRKCARSLVIIKTPLQGEKMPHRLAPSSGCRVPIHHPSQSTWNCSRRCCCLTSRLAARTTQGTTAAAAAAFLLLAGNVVPVL